MQLVNNTEMSHSRVMKDYSVHFLKAGWKIIVSEHRVLFCAVLLSASNKSFKLPVKGLSGCDIK